MLSVGRFNFDKGLHDLIMLIQKRHKNYTNKNYYIYKEIFAYMYIYIIQQFSFKYVVFESTLLNFTQTLTKLDLPTLRKGSIEERTQRNK